MPLEPEVEITVVVLNAKGLQGKKKGKGKFSVIFGLGSKKFRTDVVNDTTGNPVWNQESIIQLTKEKYALTFIVTDKENVLGQVVVELDEIPSHRSNPQTAPLRAHKKCSNPCGELSFDCWVSKNTCPQIPGDETGRRFSFNNTSPTKHRKFGKLKDKILSSDALAKIKKKGHSFSLTNLRRNSKSTYDIASGGSAGLSLYRTSSNFSIDDPDAADEADSGIGNGSGTLRSSNSFQLDSEITIPVITGISPKTVSTEGGARLTIRGDNLGVDKEDVIGLFLCGSNCLGSVEYESPNKLCCTTKPWKPCTGSVVIVTQSGGRGSSDIQLTFTEPEAIFDDVDGLKDVATRGGSGSDSFASTASGSSGLSQPEVKVDRVSPLPSPIPHKLSLTPPIDVITTKKFRSQSDDTARIRTDSEHLSVASASSTDGSPPLTPLTPPTPGELSSSPAKLSSSPSRFTRSPEIKKKTLLGFHLGGDKNKESGKMTRVVSAGSLTILAEQEQQQANAKMRSLTLGANTKPLSNARRGSLTPQKELEARVPKSGFRKESLLPWTSKEKNSLSKNELMAELHKVKQEVDRLTKQNEELEEKNRTMSTYIDSLVEKVIVTCPEILAVSSS